MRELEILAHQFTFVMLSPLSTEHSMDRQETFALWKALGNPPPQGFLT